MSKVLIIGASGFLGSSLTKFYLNNRINVGGLSRNFHNGNELIDSYAIDILDYYKLEPIIAKYDVVINCTGQITNPISKCIGVNTEGIKNIIKAVNKNNSFLIHISSVSVYGSSSIVHEQSEINPDTVYGSIKYFAEYQICQKLKNYLILRVSNLYGFNQQKGILEYLLTSYQNNKRNLYFNNNGSLKRYYLHIDDLANIINITIEKNLGGLYNIIGNDFITIEQMITLFEKVLGYSFNVKYEKFSPIDNIDKIDNSKFKKEINYSFQNNIEMYLNQIKKTY